MWLDDFVWALRDAISNEDMFMGYKRLEGLDIRRGPAISVRLDPKIGKYGYVTFLYQYPKDYILMQADLYAKGRVLESHARRFKFSKGVLVAYRLGGTGSALIQDLAKEVAEWLADVQDQ